MNRPSTADLLALPDPTTPEELARNRRKWNMAMLSDAIEEILVSELRVRQAAADRFITALRAVLLAEDI